MMNHQAALSELIHLLHAVSLTKKQKEAIQTAVGVLSWTKLSESKIKRMGKKKTQLDRQHDTKIY